MLRAASVAGMQRPGSEGCFHRMLEGQQPHPPGPRRGSIAWLCVRQVLAANTNAVDVQLTMFRARADERFKSRTVTTWWIDPAAASRENRYVQTMVSVCARPHREYSQQASVAPCQWRATDGVSPRFR